MFSRLGKRLRRLVKDLFDALFPNALDGFEILFVRLPLKIFDALGDVFKLIFEVWLKGLEGFGIDTRAARELIERAPPFGWPFFIPFILLSIPFTVTGLMQAASRGILEKMERDSLETEVPIPLSPEQAAAASARGILPLALALGHANRSGVGADVFLNLEKLQQSVPPVAVLLDARHRGIIDERTYIQLMRRNGYPPEWAQLIWEASFFYPSPSDLVTWQAREVFEPDSVEKYGLDDELERVQKDAFYRAGMTDEQIRNYWRAHWEHPSWTQILDMLYRDVLANPSDRDAVEAGSGAWQAVRQRNEQEVWEWFRLVEVPPYWRERFIRSAYLPYTRVDIRRMWELGVASDSDVIRAYLDQGYDLEHARNLLIYTRLERTLPYIKDRYRKGWINEDQVLEELRATGLPEDRVRLVYERVVKAPDQTERLGPERDLTKAEIIRGVKRNVIDRETGKRMLMELGYDEWEAEFILAINLEAGSSPETPGEMEQLVRLYQRAQGRDVPLVSERRLELERQLRDVEAKLREAREKGEEERAAELEAEKARLVYLLSQIRETEGLS